MIKLNSIKSNPNNPRTIDDEELLKLAESIKNFPEMMKIRPIVVDSGVAIGGNQRLAALKLLNYEEIPAEWVFDATNLSDKKKREFVVKDNLSAGEWDWNVLISDFETEELKEWGLDAGGFDVSPDDYGDDFDLPEGDKSSFEQITFTLSAEQMGVLKHALSEAKKDDDFEGLETYGNENSNGNALSLIVKKYSEE